MVLKQSFAYPLRIGPGGGLALAADRELTQDRLRAVIETRPRELPMDVQLGISEQVFDTVHSGGIIAERIRIALSLQLPEITCSVVGQDLPDEGATNITVTWRDGTGAQDTLTYAIGAN